jgi:hypothetical protein
MGSRRSGSRVFYILKEVKRHHQKCHGETIVSENEVIIPIDNMETNVTTEEVANESLFSRNETDNRGINFLEERETTLTRAEVSNEANEDIFHANESIADDILDTELVPQPPILSEPVLDTALVLFTREMVRGRVTKAASILVTHATLQNNCDFTVSSYEVLPRRNILLFLYLAKLVLGNGQLQQSHLSMMLQIVYPYVQDAEKDWTPIPTTVSGFQAIILNRTNRNSLISILPIPLPVAMSDGHGYTPLGRLLLMRS